MAGTTRTALDVFFESYVETALWSSTDDNDVPLDERFEVEDISPASLQSMREDCDDFMNGVKDLIEDDVSRAGHDFWLTRNGHGAGFWDGDWPEEAGKILTKRSKEYGSSYLYVGDNGKLFVS
jgi:hypothetical protein